MNLNYREILSDFLHIRKEANPSYSLRAMARDLEIPSSNLSNIMNGKAGLSRESATKIADKLQITDKEKGYFIDLVLASDARSKKEKLAAQKRLINSDLDPHRKNVHDDYFKIISDWYYFAVLELITTSIFKSDHKWLASTLDLDIELIDKIMARLLRLNLIRKEGNKYKSTDIQLQTTNDIPSSSIRKHNVQILNMASDAIFEQETTEREISSLTIAINSEDISFVKKRIREFKNSLDLELMERAKSKGANKVYCLAIQFFNLLQKENHETNKSI